MYNQLHFISFHSGTHCSTWNCKATWWNICVNYGCSQAVSTSKKSCSNMAVTQIRCAKQARTTRRFDPWFRAFEAWTEITNLSPWIRRAARHHHQHWRWCQCLHCPFGHCNIATHPTTPLSFITLIMLIITILSPPPPLPMKSLQHRPPKIPGSRLGLNSIYIRIIMV